MRALRERPLGRHINRYRVQRGDDQSPLYYDVVREVNVEYDILSTRVMAVATLTNGEQVRLELKDKYYVSQVNGNEWALFSSASRFSPGENILRFKGAYLNEFQYMAKKREVGVDHLVRLPQSLIELQLAITPRLLSNVAIDITPPPPHTVNTRAEVLDQMATFIRRSSLGNAVVSGNVDLYTRQPVEQLKRTYNSPLMLPVSLTARPTGAISSDSEITRYDEDAPGVEPLRHPYSEETRPRKLEQSWIPVYIVVLEQEQYEATTLEKTLRVTYGDTPPSIIVGDLIRWCGSELSLATAMIRPGRITVRFDDCGLYMSPDDADSPIDLLGVLALRVDFLLATSAAESGSSSNRAFRKKKRTGPEERDVILIEEPILLCAQCGNRACNLCPCGEKAYCSNLCQRYHWQAPNGHAIHCTAMEIMSGC